MLGLLLLAIVLIVLFGGLSVALSPLFLIGLVVVLLIGGGYVGRGRGWY